MIYSKSSADYAARYDLKRCFKSGFLFPLIPCAIFVYLIVANISINFSFEDEYVYKILAMEGTQNFTFFQYLYAAFGVLIGLHAFSFLTSVKKSNVYLSMGINRKQLVKNRVFSSVVYIVLSAVIPMVAALIVNKLNFMITPDLIMACSFYSLVYFTDMLLGFAISCVFTVSVGNIIESAVFSGIACLTPTITFYSLNSILKYMVNGFVSSGYSDTGFTAYCTNLLAYLTKWNPLELLESVGVISYRYVNEKTLKTLDGYDYLSVILWLVVAVAVMMLTPKLVEKRKAEIAGMTGSNKAAAGFAGGVIAFAVFAIMGEFMSKSRILCYVMCVIVPAIIYMVVIAVIFRNKTDIVKHIKGSAVTVVVSAVLTVVCASGIFGVYTSTPKEEDIEYAAVAPSSYEWLMNYTSWDRMLRDSNALYGPMTEKQDIKAVLSMHEKVADGLEKGDNTVCFVYKLKSGKVITRYYRNVSDEGAKESMKVVETGWYKNFVVSALANEKFDYKKEFANVPEGNALTSRTEQAEIDIQCSVLYKYEKYNSGDISILNSTLSDRVRLNDFVSADEIKDFRKIFAEELTQMNSEEIFYPKEQALYHVLIRFGETEEYDGPSMENIPVYPSMKNTVDFIEKHNIKLKQVTADDVASVSVKSVEKALKETAGGVGIGMRYDKSTAASFMSKEFFDEHYVEQDYAMDNRFLNEEEITDRAVIEKYFSEFKSAYSYVGDDGEFVKFVFKDGSDLFAYIPQK